jgi:hypothetical protein
MPFEFKPPRTPRQAQADMVKRRVHLPALKQPAFKPPDLLPHEYAALSPMRIGGNPLKPLNVLSPRKRR